MPDGQIVERVTLQNAEMVVDLIALGASLQSVKFHGAQMVVSGETLEDYLGPLSYAGAIVGRVANRIADARANIAGRTFALDANEPSGNCLHGGSDGAGHQVWSIDETGPYFAIFSLRMDDGHMGFPGALEVRARYELLGTTLSLDISAQSDAETLCSFAPHGYWNLSGQNNINGHELTVYADSYLPLDARQIPTGEIAEVAGSAFDFRTAREIERTALDHNFCMSAERTALRPVMKLHSPESGITLSVASTEAGLQLYDARHLGRTGLAIEPQVWPDAVNQDGFPSMVLRPNQTYRALTEFSLCKAV